MKKTTNTPYSRTTFHFLVHNLDDPANQFSFIHPEGARERFGHRLVEKCRETLYDHELDRIEVTKEGATLAVIMTLPRVNDSV